jgi:serine/threonine protein kinase
MHIKYYEYKDFSNIQKIGMGNFGKVYRANRKNSGKYFALKSFNIDKTTVNEIIHEVIIKCNYRLHKIIYKYSVIISLNFTVKSISMTTLFVFMESQQKVIKIFKIYITLKCVNKIISFKLENRNGQLKYLIVMEYADGGTLRTYLKENFYDLTWEDKYKLAYQLACAVSCLHDEEIVHRDLVIYIIISI